MVRSIAAAVPVPGTTTRVNEPLVHTPATVPGSTTPTTLEEIVLAAPVEMWFGESRIGVKAGTKTYAQFRKYADVLFGDLQAAKARNR